MLFIFLFGNVNRPPRAAADSVQEGSQMGVTPATEQSSAPPDPLIAQHRLQRATRRVDELSGQQGRLQKLLEEAKGEAQYSPTPAWLRQLRKLQLQVDESSSLLQEAQEELQAAEEGLESGEASAEELLIARSVRAAQAKHSRYLAGRAAAPLSRLSEKVFNRKQLDSAELLPEAAESPTEPMAANGTEKEVPWKGESICTALVETKAVCGRLTSYVQEVQRQSQQQYCRRACCKGL